MREVNITTKKKTTTIYEIDLVIPESCTPLGLAIWCSTNLTKKGELIIDKGIAQFIDKDDALKFEAHLVSPN